MMTKIKNDQNGFFDHFEKSKMVKIDFLTIPFCMLGV